MTRTELLEQIQETRKKLQGLEEQLEICKTKKFRIIFDVETNPDDWDWGCDEDEIFRILRGYINNSLTEIKELIGLNDTDDRLIFKSLREIKD